MGKYIKKFQTHTAYNTYITGNDKILPNVSYCSDMNELHYNPYVKVESVITCGFEFQDYDENNKIYLKPVEGGESWFSKILVDNVEISIEDIDENDGCLTSEIIQELYNQENTHTIEYTLKTNTIPSMAFVGCMGITSVTISDSVIEIVEGAFGECSGLTSVIIGKGVASIGVGCFSDCPSLASITVDSANTVYDSRDNCNAIIKTSDNSLICGCKNTVIPNTVTSIGEYAFDNCTGLTSITIPNSVTSIGSMAFYYCINMQSVVLGNNVTTIEECCFLSCTSLTNINIPNSVSTIGDSAFCECESLPSNIVSAIESINPQAFNC